MRNLPCFLGIVHYLNKHSTRLAEFGDNMHEQTKKNAPFVWGSEDTEAFGAIKDSHFHIHSKML